MESLYFADPNEYLARVESPHRLCARCRIGMPRTDRERAKRTYQRDTERAKRAYQRDPSKMVKVKCAHPGCKNTWKGWPQNVKPGLLCPDVHMPVLKQQRARERQRRYRLKAASA